MGCIDYHSKWGEIAIFSLRKVSNEMFNNKKHLFNNYYMSETMLSALYALFN